MTKIAAAVSASLSCSEAIKNYRVLHPVLADQSFPDLVQYVLTQAPNMTTGATGFAAAALSNKDVADMIAVAVKDAFAQGLQQGKQSHPARGARGVPHVPPAQSRVYCYRHGYDWHSGATCRDMQRSPDKHPAAMVAALNHTAVPGGSVLRL